MPTPYTMRECRECAAVAIPREPPACEPCRHNWNEIRRLAAECDRLRAIAEDAVSEVAGQYHTPLGCGFQCSVCERAREWQAALKEGV